MKKKKRNPQDATLRNVRALKKRVEKLEKNQRAQTTSIIANQDLILSIEERVERLEDLVKALCQGSHFVMWDK